MRTETLQSLILLFIIAMAMWGIIATIRWMRRHEVEDPNPPISKTSMHKLMSRVRDEEIDFPYKQSH